MDEFLLIFIRYVGFAILNFLNLTSDLNLWPQKVLGNKMFRYMFMIKFFRK